MMRRWLCLFLLSFPANAFPQLTPDVDQNSDYLYMPVNISLNRTYSLGHLIGHGRPIVNHLSLNIFSGYAAKLRGIEVGGFANIESEDVIGLQAAGFANVVGGSSAFFQAAGIANVVGDVMRGFQAAGIANVVNSDMGGFQGAGLANVVNGNMGGFQAAGLANIANGSLGGFQAAGLANVVNSDAGGFQVAGLVNAVNGAMGGFQAAGLVNVDGGMGGYQQAGLANVVNSWMGGFQAAGLGNVVNGAFIGMQTAGLVNVTDGPAIGVQLAGLANVAQEARYLVQAAPVNVSGSGDVLPIGLVSLVDDSPTYYDVWLTEAGFLNAGFRSGSDWFHNIVFAGIQPLHDKFRWALGWGAGLHVPVSGPLYTDLEGSMQHINEAEFWTDEQNRLGKIRAAVGWQLNEDIAIVAGPTFNWLKSRVNDGADIAPWEGTLKQSGKTWTRTWPGIDLGIRFTMPVRGMDFPYDLF